MQSCLIHEITQVCTILHLHMYMYAMNNTTCTCTFKLKLSKILNTQLHLFHTYTKVMYAIHDLYFNHLPSTWTNLACNILSSFHGSSCLCHHSSFQIQKGNYTRGDHDPSQISSSVVTCAGSSERTVNLQDCDEYETGSVSGSYHQVEF